MFKRRKKKLGQALAAVQAALWARLVALWDDRNNAGWLNDNGAEFRKVCCDLIETVGYTPERIAEIWIEKAQERGLELQRIGESNLAFRGRVLGFTEAELKGALEGERLHHLQSGEPMTPEKTKKLALKWGMILG